MPIDKEEVHATPKLTVYHLKKVIQRKLNLQCELSDVSRPAVNLLGPTDPNTPQLSISCGNMALGDEHTLSFVKDFVWRNSDSFMEVYYALKERLWPKEGNEKRNVLSLLFVRMFRFLRYLNYLKGLCWALLNDRGVVWFTLCILVN